MMYDLTVVAQGQISQAESIGELRRALSETLRRLEAAEQEIATLTAAHEAHVDGQIVGSIQGLPWVFTLAGIGATEGTHSSWSEVAP